MDFSALVRHGRIAQEDLGLVRFVDGPAKTLESLRHGPDSASTRGAR